MLANPTIVHRLKNDYTITERVYEGDICDLYACKYEVEEVEVEKPPLPKGATAWDRIRLEGEVPEPPDSGMALFKIARSSVDNDLVKHEAVVLRRIWPEGQEDEKFFRYLPRLVDSGEHESLQYNIFPRFSEYVSLADILKAYPDGIDFKDMVWMFKRALVGIGFVHKCSVVHGAMIPPHILVHPVEHGAKLIDWSYAVEDQKHPVKAMVPEWDRYYSEAILNKRRVAPATDIEMITRCMMGLVGGDPKTGKMPDAVPERIQGFMGNLLDNGYVESTWDIAELAWEVHDAFDDLLRKVVGKRKYRPFKMPEASPS